MLRRLPLSSKQYDLGGGAGLRNGIRRCFKTPYAPKDRPDRNRGAGLPPVAADMVASAAESVILALKVNPLPRIRQRQAARCRARMPGHAAMAVGKTNGIAARPVSARTSHNGAHYAFVSSSKTPRNTFGLSGASRAETKRFLFPCRCPIRGKCFRQSYRPGFSNAAAIAPKPPKRGMSARLIVSFPKPGNNTNNPAEEKKEKPHARFSFAIRFKPPVIHPAKRGTSKVNDPRFQTNGIHLFPDGCFALSYDRVMLPAKKAGSLPTPKTKKPAKEIFYL